jgi:hypothetical protein
MDSDDIYTFPGIRVNPLLAQQGIELRKLYRDNIDTDSFIIYRKLAGEIWFVIGTKILVFHMERGEWYLRETDIAPRFGFLDFDDKMYVASATAIVQYDHSESSWDESTGYSVKTRIIDLNGNKRWHKKIDELSTYLKSSGNITVTFNDDNESLASANTLTTPTTLQERRIRDHKFFKNLYIEIENAADANNLTATLEEMTLFLETWK